MLRTVTQVAPCRPATTDSKSQAQRSPLPRKRRPSHLIFMRTWQPLSPVPVWAGLHQSLIGIWPAGRTGPIPTYVSRVALWECDSKLVEDALRRKLSKIMARTTKRRGSRSNKLSSKIPLLQDMALSLNRARLQSAKLQSLGGFG
jgi:hypothetical protein